MGEKLREFKQRKPDLEKGRSDFLSRFSTNEVHSEAKLMPEVSKRVAESPFSKLLATKDLGQFYKDIPAIIDDSNAIFQIKVAVEKFLFFRGKKNIISLKNSETLLSELKTNISGDRIRLYYKKSSKGVDSILPATLLYRDAKAIVCDQKNDKVVEVELKIEDVSILSNQLLIFSPENLKTWYLDIIKSFDDSNAEVNREKVKA